MQLLWAFHEVLWVAAQKALEQAALLVVTTDVALKIYGRAAVPTSPASRLMRLKQAAALLMDEI